jgi:hypothetical protein
MCLPCESGDYCLSNGIVQTCPTGAYTLTNISGETCTVGSAATCSKTCEGGNCPSGLRNYWWGYYALCSRCTNDQDVYKPASAIGIGIRVIVMGGASLAGCSLTIKYLDNDNVWKVKQTYGCGGNAYYPNTWIYMIGISRVRLTYYVGSQAVGYQAEYASIYPRGAMDATECICGDALMKVKINTSSLSYSCMCNDKGIYMSNTSCEFCSAGSWCNNGIKNNCPSGRYQTATGMYLDTSCILCPNGTFSIMIGSNSLSNCMNCTAGTYSSAYGASVCMSCTAGTYSSAYGASACMNCPVNSSSPAGSYSYSACTCVNSKFLYVDNLLYGSSENTIPAYALYCLDCVVNKTANILRTSP